MRGPSAPRKRDTRNVSLKWLWATTARHGHGRIPNEHKWSSRRLRILSERKTNEKSFLFRWQGLIRHLTIRYQLLPKRWLSPCFSAPHFHPVRSDWLGDFGCVLASSNRPKAVHRSERGEASNAPVSPSAPGKSLWSATGVTGNPACSAAPQDYVLKTKMRVELKLLNFDFNIRTGGSYIKGNFC